MPRQWEKTWVQFLALTALWGIICLPNLGGADLWDIDEGNNAEAAYEMLESGNWVVPTFNYRLRVDKPALLYWLQILSYKMFGVNEFAARFPSALGGLASLWLIWGLGRLMFGPLAGFLAGIFLLTMPAWAGAAHFANPDSLLNASITATLFLFWQGYQKQNSRYLGWAGITTGLGMLAKGPIALALPGLILFPFLLWEKRLLFLASWHLLSGALLFLLVAAPWYAWVGVETKFEWHRGFFLTHNLGRFQTTMENHSGPWFYYLLVISVGALPWSAFLLLTAFQCKKDLGNSRQGDGGKTATRFLLCWVLPVLGFFSLSGTKLPNYILPLYPALALLTARAFQEWLRDTTSAPSWVMNLGTAAVSLTGLLVFLGLLVGSGQGELALLRGRKIPGLELMAPLGLGLLVSGILAFWNLKTCRPWRSAQWIMAGAIFLTTGLCWWNGASLNQIKAPRKLASFLPANHLTMETRLGHFDWFQPSLIFYCQREVSPIKDPSELEKFLRHPSPSFVFLPKKRWEELKDTLGPSIKPVGQATDFYKNCEVVLLANRS